MASSTENDFDSALHQLMSATGRPKTDDDVKKLRDALANLYVLCDKDRSRWKSFVLAIVYKRYHLKAPEAKSLAKDGDHDNNKATVVTGDGERRLFYVAVGHMFEHVLRENKDEMVQAALMVLIEVCPFAGGSRDVCTIITVFLEVMLPDLEKTRSDMVEMYGKESVSNLVAHGLTKALAMKDGARDALERILRIAANTLDEDKRIVMNDSQSSDVDMLPSTLHIFIPHRDRGKRRKGQKKVPDRQLVNSIAEIMIWSRTSLQADKSFASTYERLLQSDSLTRVSVETAKSSLHRLQTIIRRERQILNSYARNKGFMLNDLLQLDRDAITYAQIKRGKAGDLTEMTRLAKKFNLSGILRMVAVRFAANPSKITRFKSIGELTNSWAPLSEDSTGEIAKLEHDIQVARLQATITHLRKLVSDKSKKALVASLDHESRNKVAALLTAAAFGRWQIDGDASMSEEESAPIKLFANDAIHEVDSFDTFKALLDNLITVTRSSGSAPSMADHEGNATVKAVMNLIERHLEPGQALLVFTEKDLKLRDETLASLRKRDCTIHCHDIDNVGERLEREGARAGDITISLAWDTHDDLDLHVTIPSDEVLYYGNRYSKDKLCNLDVDMNAGSPYSSEPVENVYCGDLDRRIQAPKGKYKVVVNNYAYHAKDSKDDTPIHWRIVVNKNGKKQKYEGTIAGRGSDQVACEFDYQGRTIPFPQDEGCKSAFGVADLVSVTVSTGQTLEALSQVVLSTKQHEHMNEVRQLMDDREDQTEQRRPVVSATYEVTSRDRNNLLLFNLPRKFHEIVGEAFGGPNLAEQCASSIAQRMVQDKIPLSELKKCGYPDTITDAVKTVMTRIGA